MRRESADFEASNYGEAAAVDVYGTGLPPALSEEDQYFLWGTHGFEGNVIVAINARPNRWSRYCRTIVVAGYFGARYAMPYENHRPILVCHDLRVSLPLAWPRHKRYG
jgi:hypothetical protein